MDEKGRYSLSVKIDGEIYTGKFFPCGSEVCIANGSNLDRSDPQSIAYTKALSRKAIKDISTGVTAASMISPTGSVGVTLNAVGLTLSGLEAIYNNSAYEKLTEETTKFAAEKFLVQALQHSPASAGRIVLGIELLGGWQPFSEAIRRDIVEYEVNNETIHKK